MHLVQVGKRTSGRRRDCTGYSAKNKAMCTADGEQARRGDAGGEAGEVRRGRIMCFHVPVG